MPLGPCRSDAGAARARRHARGHARPARRNPFTAISPLLHVLQRVTFILFGATDGTARFWTALLAGLSPLLFYFLREAADPGRRARGGLPVGGLAAWRVERPPGARRRAGPDVQPRAAGGGCVARPWTQLGLIARPGGRPPADLTGSNAYTALLAGAPGLAWFAPEAGALVGGPARGSSASR